MLKRLNEKIEGLGRRYDSAGSTIIFVLGAPRSGTTILTQILAVECGYITNVAARFWENPAMGIAVSRDIEPSPGPTFRNNFGRTPDPMDVHEMGYFWRKRLGLSSQRDAANLRDVSGVQWKRLERDLFAISNAFPAKKYVVMKGCYAAYVYYQLQEMLQGKVIWLHVKRPFLQNCAAIKSAIDKTGKQPFGWPAMIRTPYRTGAKQIAQQVNWWQQWGDSIADKTIMLEGLCNRPRLAVEILGLRKDTVPNRLPYHEYSASHLAEFVGLEGVV